MNNKFTPGTWEYSGNGEVIGISQSETGERIALLRPANEANARLIAAAPDLYEALDEAIGFMEVIQKGLHTPTLARVLNQLRQAKNKADGNR